MPSDAPTTTPPRPTLAERAAKLHDLIVPSWSAMWPLIGAMQRAGLIRLEWLGGKRAKLRYVPPAQEACTDGQ